jgi:hypothetical protein
LSAACLWIAARLQVGPIAQTTPFPLIGDGRLNYGTENILEMFYDWQVIEGNFVTADFQEVDHPAYNRDRGPVSIWTGRAHIEFYAAVAALYGAD